MACLPKKIPTTLADRSIAASDSHFKPIIQLEMTFDHALDVNRLTKALALTMRVHPILGCRFAPRILKPRWETVEKHASELFSYTEKKTEFEAFKTTEPDYFSEPQIAVCLYRTVQADHLVLKISHLSCDAAGVKDIAGTLSKIYNRLAREPDLAPTPHPHDARGLWYILRHIPWYAYPRIVLNFAGELLTSAIPYKSHRVPVQDTSQKRVRYVTRHIGKKETACLIAYAKAHDATINDVLLTAIFRSLSKIGAWDAKSALRMGITIDLRRYLTSRESAPVANFSSIETITCGTLIEDRFEETLARISALLSKRKASWLGLSAFVSTYPSIWLLPFPILRMATRKGWESRYNTPNASDLFTNMGDVSKESLNFDGYPKHARLLPPGCKLPILFFGCNGYNSALYFTASVLDDNGNKAVTETFFTLMVSELPLTQA